jgi:hypothetical protein
MEKRRSIVGWSVLALGLLGAAAPQAWATPAGDVELVRGVVLLQSPGQGPRTAGRGVALEEGDRLSTAEGSLAMIRLKDGTRMTVRPGTDLEIAKYRFTEGAADNSMLMRLLRGGLRTVTGLISKGAPDAAKIQTNTATIGIRGTDFDARLCAQDCAAESAQVSDASHATTITASAKVISVHGSGRVEDDSPYRRQPIAGTSLYPGNVLASGPDGAITLGFRDGTRMTLGPDTRVRLDNFVFDEQNPREGRFLASLLAGEMRVVSGSIAQAQPRNAVVGTATGSVELRSAGADLRCSGACAGEAQGAGFEVSVWQGAAAVAAQGRSEQFVVQQGQGVVVVDGQVRPAAAVLVARGVRPDAFDIPAKMFAREAVAESAEGLFVQVRDGHIEMDTAAGQALHLGRGETGFAGNGGNVARPLVIPKFIEYDRVPLPVMGQSVMANSLVMAENRSAGQCR